jgi:hypothetical protein
MGRVSIRSAVPQHYVGLRGWLTFWPRFPQNMITYEKRIGTSKHDRMVRKPPRATPNRELSRWEAQARRTRAVPSDIQNYASYVHHSVPE